MKVTFPTGSDIKAGDTKVQFEGMDVGSVESVRFAKDLHRLDVVLQLNSDIAGHLGKGTLFWISAKPEHHRPGLVQIGHRRPVYRR